CRGCARARLSWRFSSPHVGGYRGGKELEAAVLPPWNLENHVNRFRMTPAQHGSSRSEFVELARREEERIVTLMLLAECVRCEHEDFSAGQRGAFRHVSGDVGSTGLDFYP